MDFRLTEDQRLLRSETRRLFTALFPRERLRQSVEAVGEDFDRALWRKLGDAGLFSLRLPERDGGAALALPEAVLLFEEAGRALLPGPLTATHLAAGLVPGAAEGTCVVTAVDRPGPAEHLATADALLLLDGPRPRLLPAAQLSGLLGALPDSTDSTDSIDPTTPLHLLPRLPPPDTTRPIPEAAASRLLLEATVLTAAQQLGSAGRTLEMAVDHAKVRTQFGRPIGAFQAVQHLCAQMLVRTELARAAVYAASLTALPPDVAAAKLLADEAAVRNARDCLQVHGGLGFTWEADVHLHLKRAWLRAAQWQTAARAETALAEELLADRRSVPPQTIVNPLGRNPERPANRQ
ncbi:acyl-CoA dehydrogenase family protein [Streptomyces orinoci]|uniref:Acyl-CoA dehydrogenase family protein n=1 Tax=Streptomyces orinoci TaxID=67339 RepID=A0ABV3JYC4_STRON|nr:acyl-CoA dehydrogenase family protein [Streptomyces orinoci]